MASSINHTIVFVHGNSSSSKVFSSQVGHFTNAIAEDLSGHGLSTPSKDPYGQYSVSGMRKSLIEKHKDKESLIMVGNSLGGHLSIEIAPELPNLKGLILFGAPPVKKPLNVDEAFHPTEALSAYFQGEFDESHLRDTLHVIAYKKEHVEVLIQDFMRTDLIFRDVWAKSVLQDKELMDEVQIIKSLDLPVYVINGKQDPSVNLDYVRSLEGITRIYEIDECGHYPSLEQPDQFNKILEEILQEIPS